MFSVFDFIPSRYIFSLKNDMEIEMSNVSRFLERRKLISNIKLLVADFEKLDLVQLGADKKEIEENPLLVVSDADKECNAYNIAPLNKVKIFKILNDLYFEKIYTRFFIIKECLDIIETVIDKKRFSSIQELVLELDIIDNCVKQICYEKNLKDFYDNRMGNVKKDIVYLRQYIKALEIL